MAGTSKSGRHLSEDGELDRMSEDVLECRGRLFQALEQMKVAALALNSITRRLSSTRERLAASRELRGKAA